MNRHEIRRKIQETEAEHQKNIRMLKPLTEARSLTVGQEREFDELLRSVESSKAAIEELRAMTPDDSGIHSSPGYDNRFETHTTDEFRGDVTRMSRDELRDQGLRTLEKAGKGLEARQGDHLDMLLRSHSDDVDGSKIARRLLVTERSSYKSAFSKVLQGITNFSPDESASLDEFRAMSEGDMGSGGYGVPVMIDPTIILTAGAGAAPIVDIARIVTITTNAWKGVASAPPTWSYDAEGSAVSDDTTALTQPNIPIWTARGFIPFSLEVGMDYPDFAGELQRLLAQGYLDRLAAATATGSGSLQPTGIFTAIAANAAQQVITNTDGSLGAIDVRKLWTALPERYRGRATWVMSTSVETQLANDANALSLSALTVNPLLGSLPTLFGRPVVLTDYAPAFTGTTLAASIMVLGDFSNYVIAQRAGMSVELVQNLFDVTYNRPTGQRGFFAFARHGADSSNVNGFRILVNS